MHVAHDDVEAPQLQHASRVLHTRGVLQLLDPVFAQHRSTGGGVT